MSSLGPDFQYDVFVSYAHWDPLKKGKALLKTWSQAFVAELEEELRIDPEWSDPKFFLDTRDIENPHAPLDKKISEALSNSALMLVLMSPHYLKSEACKKERALWFEKAESEAFAGTRGRVLFARILPVLDSEWPKEFRDGDDRPPIGRWFFEQPGRPKTRPFGWPDPTGGSGKFRDNLIDLSGDIGARMRELKEAIERKKREAANAERRRHALYLHARQLNLSRWEEDRKKLISAGFFVAPATPEKTGSPSDLDEFDKESVRAISACDAILLVSGDDPNHLVSDLVVIGHQRRNSATAKSKRPLPCAVVDHGIRGNDKALLQQSAKNMQIDWITASGSSWTNDVRTWLNQTP
jgi:TIR domain